MYVSFLWTPSSLETFAPIKAITLSFSVSMVTRMEAFDGRKVSKVPTQLRFRVMRHLRLSAITFPAIHTMRNDLVTNVYIFMFPHVSYFRHRL